MECDEMMHYVVDQVGFWVVTAENFRNIRDDFPLDEGYVENVDDRRTILRIELKHLRDQVAHAF